MRNHQIECIETLFQLFRSPPMKSTQTIEYQSLRDRNNKNFIVPPTVYYEKKTVYYGKN